MFLKVHFCKFKFGLIFIFSILFLEVDATTFLITANTNWTAIAGGPPTSSDIIIVKNGATLTINTNTAVCASITLGDNVTAPTGNGTLSFNAASQLTVSGAVSLGSAARTGNIVMTLGGTLICNSIAQTGNANTATLTQGTGTIELKTTNTLPNSTNMVNYNNLTINGGTTSLGTGITINGNLVITSGTFSVGNVNLTITGTTTITSTLTIASAVGTNTFVGLITNNGTFNNSGNAAVNIRGGITNNSTFTAGSGTYTFNTNSQALGGSSAISFGGVVAISGAISITNQNTASISITGNLTGSVAGSTWINAASSTLNVAGALLATGTLTASANSNTVNYNGVAAQSIKLGTYHNLTVTSGNTATFGGTTIINNDFTVASGTASLGAFSLTVTGATSITGTFSITSATGTKTFANITVNSGGAWNSTAAETYAISGNLTMSGGSIAGSATGVYNVGGNLVITVSTTNSIGAGTLSITGTTSINGTLNFTSTTGTKTFNGAVTMGSGSIWNSTAAETYTMNSTLTMSGGSITGTATANYNVGTNLIVTASTSNSIGVGNLSISGTTAINGTLNFTSTTGTKTFTGVVTIGSGGVWSSSVAETYALSSNLVMSGGSITGSAAGTYNVSGNLSITAATSNTVGVGTLTIAGTSNIGAGGSIDFSSTSGTKRFTGLITNAGTWTSSANESFDVRGGITNNGTWTGGTGTYTLSTNSQTISGSSTLTFGGVVAISGNRLITNQATVSISGNLTGTIANSRWTNAAGSTLNIGGALLNTGTLTATAVSNTVNYNGAAAQSIYFTNYNNLSVTKTGGSTATLTGDATISGNLTVTSGTADVGGFILAVTGTTSVTGTLSIASTVGTETFTNVIVNTGGTWNVTVVEPITINGNIQNDGTFNASTGVYTLAGITKTISGTSNLAIPNATITGSYTNNATLFTVSTALIGAGSLTQGANSTLALGGTNTITTFFASVNPNLVDFTGAGAQSIRATTYHNLSITKTGGSTGTFVGITIVNNDLTVTSGVGSVGAFALTVTGNTSISGTLDITSATGVKTFGNVIVNTGGIWNSTAVIAYTINGNIQNDGTFTSNTGVYTLAGATKTLSGTSGLSISNATVSGTYTNNGTFTVGLNLIGAGTLTQGSSSTLNIGDVITVSNLVATTVSNIVNYNGAGAQSIKATTYHNLSVTKTGGSTGILAGNTIVNNDFTITSGIANIPGVDFTVSGNTSITGTLSISSTTGTKTFKNVTVNSGGIWNATAAEDIAISGNIQNDGTITSNTGIYTFSGSGKTFSGANPVTISKISISGTYTNNATITCATALSGVGSLTQATNANLNIGGTDGITTLDASTNVNTVTYNGSATQSISLARTFYNLTINNSTGVSIATNQNLKDALTLTSGVFNTGGGIFTFLSTSTLTARIAPVTGSGSVSGNITMQRFAPGGTTSWAMLSAPMAATLASWTDDFPTSGFTGSTGNAQGFISIQSYNEAATGTSDNGYVVATSSTDAITPGKGYFVYLGTGFSSTTDINIDVVGAPIIGNKSLPVTFTSSGGAANDGWNLVANPYPSAIDWEAVAWTKTNMNTTFYVYNADVGNYASYTTGGATTNGGTRYIPSSQGFFVQANAASPILNTTENVKVSNNPTFLRLNSANSYNPALISFKVTSTATSFYDETVVRFMPLATNQFDGQFDAYKLFSSEPTAPSLSTVIGVNEYAVNSFPEIGYEQVIPLRVKVGASANTKLSWTGINNFPEGSCLMLEDTYTHTLTDLNADSSYSFYINDTTVAPRFLIHVSQPYKTEVISDACNGFNTGEILINSSTQQNFSYTVVDSLGVIINSANNVLIGNVSNLYSGNYAVNYTSSNAMCPSATVNVNIADQANVTASFVPSTDTLYLNSNNIISFDNTSFGSSVFEWNFGDGTQSTAKNPIHQFNTTGTYDVTLIAGSSTCTDTSVVRILVINQSVQSIKNNFTSNLTIGNNASSVWIEFNEEKNTNSIIKIYNVVGAQIADISTTVSKGNFYLNGYLPVSGIYMVQVIIDGETISKKVNLIK